MRYIGINGISYARIAHFWSPYTLKKCIQCGIKNIGAFYVFYKWWFEKKHLWMFCAKLLNNGNWRHSVVQSTQSGTSSIKDSTYCSDQIFKDIKFHPYTRPHSCSWTCSSVAIPTNGVKWVYLILFNTNLTCTAHTETHVHTFYFLCSISASWIHCYVTGIGATILHPSATVTLTNICEYISWIHPTDHFG